MKLTLGKLMLATCALTIVCASMCHAQGVDSLRALDPHRFLIGGGGDYCWNQEVIPRHEFGVSGHVTYACGVNTFGKLEGVYGLDSRVGRVRTALGMALPVAGRIEPAASFGYSWWGGAGDAPARQEPDASLSAFYAIGKQWGVSGRLLYGTTSRTSMWTLGLRWIAWPRFVS